MTRSDTCSRFLEITYQNYFRPGPGLITNQIISFIFARTIYDEFDANAMATDRIITAHSFRQL